MPAHHMAAAGLAPLAVGLLVLVVLVDLVLALRDLDCVVRPEREGVDRSGRPAPAVLAVAVAGACRLAGDLDLDGTAHALALVRRRIRAHQVSSSRVGNSADHRAQPRLVRFPSSGPPYDGAHGGDPGRPADDPL